MKRILITSLLLLFFVLQGYAQCDICAVALRQETTDNYQRQTGYSLDETIKIMYSQSYEFWEKYNASEKKNSQFDAAYESFTAAFTSSSNKASAREEFEKSKKEYAYSSMLSQSAYEKISQKLISKTPYEAFIRCVEACMTKGVYVSYVMSGNNFIVTATFRPSNGPADQKTKLKSFSATNGEQVNKSFKNGIVLTPFNSVSSLFKRTDPKMESVVKLNFENYPTDPIIIKPLRTGSAIMPVGSIICSVLEYSNFCLLNEIPNQGPSSELIWVPADGRDVAGSRYADKIAKVPDLRGVFLRGLNIFDTNNNPVNSDSRPLDLTQREPGSFQLQSIQQHTHNIEDPGHNHGIKLKNPGAGGIGATGRDDSDASSDHGTVDAVTGIKILKNTSVADETRPNNVAVYYYIKIN